MKALMRLRSFFRNFACRADSEGDLDAEVRAHLDLLTEEKIREGLAPAEARRAARIELGGLEQLKEEVRAARSGAWLEQFWQDARFGARQLRRNPGFTTVAVLTLALGIGANAAIFSIINAVLLRPLPFDDSSRLVRLFHVPPQKSFPGVTRFSVSPANYIDWKAQAHSFEGMAPYGLSQGTVTGGERAEPIVVGRLAPDFFSLVRTPASLGRLFRPGEDQPESAPVVVLSDAYWKSRFGAAPDVLGRDMIVDHVHYTVVGVMPPAFSVRSWGATSAQVWIPLVWTSADRAIRGNHNFNVIARLNAGATLQQSRAEMDAISARLAREYPNENMNWGATVVPLSDLIVEGVRSSLWILFGAVGFVLLIACANIANLSLARALSRRKELAVRTSLGADRSHLVRQLLCETTLVSLIGGLAGYGLARLAITLGASLLESQLPAGINVNLDAPVLAFTLAVSIVSGLVAGIWPALRASKSDLNEVLKQGLGRAGSISHQGVRLPRAFAVVRGNLRTRNLLIMCEVALSLILLAGAGLMLRTLAVLRGLDPGFDPDNVLAMTISIPQQKYATSAQQSAFYDELLRRVRALPAVESAAFVDSLPMSGGSMQPVTLDGRAPASAQDETELAVRNATPQYIRTVRIPVKRGRDFREDDDHALLISESLARTYWPNQDPIAHHISFTFTPGPAWQVVGVVGDVPDESLSTLRPRPTVYQWTRERPWTFLQLVVRTNGDPLALAQPIVAALRQLDPEQPAQNITTMRQVVDASISSQRFVMWLLSLFAALALLLAGCGIYGVLSYAVRQRTREIGIRAALGAQVGRILAMVLADALRPVALGIILGLAGAFSLGSVLQSFLFGVKPADAPTLAVVSLLIVITACLASLVPAVRASRVDPLQVLREE